MRCPKNKAVPQSFTTLGPDLCSAELSLKAEFTPEVEQLETSEIIAIDVTMAYSIVKTTG